DGTIDLGPQNPRGGAIASPGAVGVPALQFTVTAGSDDLQLLFLQLGAIAGGALDPTVDVTDVQIVDSSGAVIFDKTFTTATKLMPSGLSVDTVTASSVASAAPWIVARTQQTFTVLLSFSPSAPSGGAVQIILDSSGSIELWDDDLIVAVGPNGTTY